MRTDLADFSVRKSGRALSETNQSSEGEPIIRDLLDKLPDLSYVAEISGVFRTYLEHFCWNELGSKWPLIEAGLLRPDRYCVSGL